LWWHVVDGAYIFNQMSNPHYLCYGFSLYHTIRNYVLFHYPFRPIMGENAKIHYVGIDLASMFIAKEWVMWHHFHSPIHPTTRSMVHCWQYDQHTLLAMGFDPLSSPSNHFICCETIEVVILFNVFNFQILWKSQL
jgi:hypothetical protein